MARCEAIHQQTQVHQAGVEAQPPIFQKMEETEAIARSRWPQNPSVGHSLTALPENFLTEAEQVIDQLGNEIQGGKYVPLARRLFAMNQRIAEATGSFINRCKNRDHGKKEETEGHVETLKSWTNWQACWAGVGGFGGAILTLASAAFGKANAIGAACKILARLSSSGVEVAKNYIDGAKMNPTHEKDLYMQFSSHERQALENLKQLPEGLKRHVSELLRLELEACRAPR